MPKRIQRKRKKGWMMPEGTVYVGRPSKWGNPFRVGRHYPTATAAVRAFRVYAAHHAYFNPNWLEPLRGKDLACWCKLSDPCHADVLLELANRPT